MSLGEHLLCGMGGVFKINKMLFTICFMNLMKQYTYDVKNPPLGRVYILHFLNLISSSNKFEYDSIIPSIWNNFIKTLN